MEDFWFRMDLLKRASFTGVDQVNNTEYEYLCILCKARCFRSNNDIRRTLITVKIYNRILGIYIYIYIKSNANNFHAEIKATNATTTAVVVYIYLYIYRCIYIYICIGIKYSVYTEWAEESGERRESHYRRVMT